MAKPKVCSEIQPSNKNALLESTHLRWYTRNATCGCFWKLCVKKMTCACDAIIVANQCTENFSWRTKCTPNFAWLIIHESVIMCILYYTLNCSWHMLCNKHTWIKIGEVRLNTLNPSKYRFCACMPARFISISCVYVHIDCSITHAPI